MILLQRRNWCERSPSPHLISLKEEGGRERFFRLAYCGGYLKTAGFYLIKGNKSNKRKRVPLVAICRTVGPADE